MMRKRAYFIKLIQVWGIIFLIGLGISIVAIDVIGSHREFNLRADQMRADYIGLQKRIIKQEVDRVVHMIRYEKTQSEILTKQKIKSRVYEAYSIAQNIYQQNKATRNETEIQQMILDALRPIRFENGRGYYFATRLDGVEVLFADRPEMEGSNLQDMQDTRGRYVIKDMITIANQSDEGFYEYHWTKPESAGNDFKKISFIKRFEPYEWFIGTGLYVDDVESQIKADLLSDISRIRFGKEGYIFINEFNGNTLVSNGELFSGTKKLWEVFNDDPEKMKDIFEKEYDAALKPEGDYIYYSHIKLTKPDEESKKVSFIYGIPEMKWLVGAGVYLDEVETSIAWMQAELNNQIKVKIVYFILIVVGIVGLFFLFFTWLNRRLKNDFNLFVSFFNRAANSDEGIERENIKFVELDQMAEYANKMLEDRKKAEEALRESEERWKFALEGSGDGVWDWNAETNRVFFSRQWKAMLGYDEEDIGDTLDEWDSRVYHDDRPAVDASIKALFRGEATVYQNEHRLLCKDGSYKWILDRGKIIEWTEDGKPKRMIGTHSDISERKKAEVEREKLQEQLTQAQRMESIGRLAGGVAHDFNNMLSVILGHTELALEQADLEQPIYGALQEIQKAAQRSADVTRQLLAFARKQTIAPKVLDLNKTVKSMLKMLRRLIGEDIGLVWLPATHLWPVRVDHSQIDQILANLCVNGRDAIAGVGKITIETGKVTFDEAYCKDHPGFVPGDFVMLAVSDDGCGMDKETLNKIFEPFFTTKDVDKGTGLGLATVYGIVKQNNGFVDVHSEPDKGTTFKIYLPRHEIAVEQARRKGLVEPDARGSETILLVEDESSILKMVTMMLQRLGYTVLTAITPGEAIALAREYAGQIHLLMTDVVMPEMNGRELAGNLLTIYPNLKRLFMSGYTADVIAHHGVLDPGVHFIQKPFSMKLLSIRVREVLDEDTSTSQE